MAMSNIVNVRPDGPNVMTGDLSVVTRARPRAMKTAFLCRCGLSADKPFCDGAHVKGGFRDPALLATEGELASEVGGRVTVTPRENGPLRCEGPLTVCDAAGRISRSDPTFLCRCGGSRNKPFCDGTHKKIGFRG